MFAVTRMKEMLPADELMLEVAEEMDYADTFRLEDVGIYFGEPEVTMPDPYFDGGVLTYRVGGG